MKYKMLLGAVTLGAATASIPALADDPYERLSPEELEHDREDIRRLNREQLAFVRERDARYTEGWRAYGRDAGPPEADSRGYQQQLRAYKADRQRYEKAMAEWRQNVAACRAGNYEYCRR
jgi:hypothetical protein